MKQQRSFVRSITVAVALLGSACGPDEPDVFAPGTFAGTFQNEIRASCQHTVDCKKTNDYDACVTNTAQVLEREQAKQLAFLTNFTRCSLSTRCEFVACADAKQVYGESQRAKVNNSCQQKYACEMSAGRPLPNVEFCTAEGIGKLDSFAAQERANFELAYNNCSTLMGCQFVSCFFAP